MARERSRKPGWQRDIARERIEILFGLAGREFQSHRERSKRYVGLARRIGMRYNVRIPEGLKGSFCRKCSSYLKPGVNSRARTSPRQRALVIKCLECGSISRHPYRRERKAGKKPRP
jgi:ribonuclease P protein subunit RPR2